ncbi:MAG TPA: SAM-dependent methyltransferase, partial [Candidatus Nitrosocosmicus sp.]|nr:SAM-dependent methyltransferase [Candidatus Nitrosocosmicus sp.]
MLHIVGTPIGNLDDLSYRQAQTLGLADIILTEDTRSATAVLNKIPDLFGISLSPNQKLIPYYKEKEFEKLPQIIGWLEEDKNIALISESGLPLISDPGLLLIKTVIKKNIPYTVIPGPTAVTTSLLYSGFDPQNFMFLGFLPKKRNEICKIIEKIK